ncbi:hypothetical protein FACS1894166_07100 [Bacilli bacterium]|nr:hypothetical protein FACS1894166_07100 [Bacilli bacterium]
MGSLAIIPETTFQLCASLTSVVATSVTDVSKRFINCSSLKSVETGVMLSSASVTTAFNGCPSLTIDGLKGLKVDNTTLFKH